MLLVVLRRFESCLCARHTIFCNLWSNVWRALKQVFFYKWKPVLRLSAFESDREQTAEWLTRAPRQGRVPRLFR
jgi:hypothetical protein